MTTTQAITIRPLAHDGRAKQKRPRSGHLGFWHARVGPGAADAAFDRPIGVVPGGLGGLLVDRACAGFGHDRVDRRAYLLQTTGMGTELDAHGVGRTRSEAVGADAAGSPNAPSPSAGNSAAAGRLRDRVGRRASVIRCGRA